MPTGKYERSKATGDAIRKGIEQRKAKGLSFGRQAEFVMKGRHCLFCKTWFHYKFYPKRAEKRLYCNNDCHMAHEREKRRKVPHDFDLLYDLYWNQNLSTIEIGARFETNHSVIKRRMIQLGIPRRKRGRYSTTACIVSGCLESAYKIVHTNNGSPYGRRCLIHWTLHRKRLSADYWIKLKEAKGNSYIGAVEKAVPATLPYEIRDEVCQELIVALLTGELTPAELKTAAPTYIRRFFKEYQNKYGDLSLDAPIGEGGLTLGHLLTTDGTLGSTT